MVYIIENRKIKILVNSYGAELNSILSKDGDIEYLWNRDPSGWKYQTPILFPIVGKLKNLKYMVEGKTYELPQHGLARLSEFSLVESSNNSIKLELIYSQESLRIYPFKFKLSCEYLLNNNEIEVRYSVSNLDNKKIYFSIGAHPAFICPREENEVIEDYYLEFNKKETASIMLLTDEGYLNRKSKLHLDNSNIISLSSNIFENDALIFSNLNSDVIKLKCKQSDRSVSVDFSMFPYLGIWAPKNGANLICIEPWYGHTDFYDFYGDFSEKPGIIALDIDKTFNCSYKIIIN